MAMTERIQVVANRGVFMDFASLCRGFPLLQAEVENLKHTVWKRPLGTLGLLVLEDSEKPTLHLETNIGLAKTVLLANRAFVPCQRQVF